MPKRKIQEQKFKKEVVLSKMPFDECSAAMVEGVLILRNSSLKLKTVVNNAILLNYAVSPENISESIKAKAENCFHFKVIVCKFR